MKVVSITMVKNEVDIIESFIRYNSKIVDEMIILDNGSTDDTVNIINNLIGEGLSIVLIHDTDSFYNQDVKMTKLLHKAVYEFDADIVCVIDADEFISSPEGNPHEIIKNLDLSTYYQLKWVTYIITGSEDDDIKFIPSKFDCIRERNMSIYIRLLFLLKLLKTMMFP